MRKIPAPPIDVREHFGENPITEESKEDPRRFHSMSYTRTEIMKKQLQDLRSKILDYRVVGMRTNPKFNYDNLPNHCDIILFGPTGSGKSSLIRTFYSALYHTTLLSPEIGQYITVKEMAENEGTTEFIGVFLKDQEKKIIKTSLGDIPENRSAIIIHDTRGQIWMDRKEEEQMKLMLSGKLKNMSRVEQRTYRYAYMLWEFWKRENQLFPSSIISKGANLRTQPHCIIFVFDGSMDEIPNGIEEINFFKKILQHCREKRYYYPQIVLTRMDKLEQKVRRENKLYEGFALEQKLRDIIDMKIESVVLALGVPRSSVYFIENYHGKPVKNHLKIDYNALRLLYECVQQADTFLQSSLKEKSRCSIF